MGSLAEPKLRILTRPFSCWQVTCFNASVTLSGDLDDQRGMLEAIPDGVRDHWVADDFGPVVQRKLARRAIMLVNLEEAQKVLDWARAARSTPTPSAERRRTRGADA